MTLVLAWALCRPTGRITAGATRLVEPAGLASCQSALGPLLGPHSMRGLFSSTLDTFKVERNIMKPNYENMTIGQAVWLGAKQGVSHYFSLGPVLWKLVTQRGRRA